jgi:hypothetical protein
MTLSVGLLTNFLLLRTFCGRLENVSISMVIHGDYTIPVSVTRQLKHSYRLKLQKREI